MSVLYNLFQKNRRGGSTSQLTLWGQSYCDTKTRQRQYQKKNTKHKQTNISWGSRCHNFNKILTNWIKQYKKVYTMTKWNLFHIWRAGSTIKYQCKLTKKNDSINWHRKSIRKFNPIHLILLAPLLGNFPILDIPLDTNN